MFEPNSRYYSVEDASLETRDGSKIAYKKRRFLPDWSKMAVIQEIKVNEGDRLDIISARVIGDPEQFWRICDANNIMHPLEITSDIGRSIKVARPWG